MRKPPHAPLLVLGLGALLCLPALPARADDPRGSARREPGKRPRAPEAIEIRVPNLGERVRFRPYDERGRLRKKAEEELTRLLRCPHTGKRRAADPRLLPLLYSMGRHFGRPLIIFSGFRPRQIFTVPRSRHLSASAIDFRIEGIKNDELVRWLRAREQSLGVGYYPDGVHVHLDVDRRRDAYWVKRGKDRLRLRPAPGVAARAQARPPPSAPARGTGRLTGVRAASNLQKIPLL